MKNSRLKNIAVLVLLAMITQDCSSQNQEKMEADSDGKTMPQACLTPQMVSPIPPKAELLMAAYPMQKMNYRDGYICFADGDSILYDDQREKSFAEMLDNSDLEDMFSLTYDTIDTPDYLADAGRSRNEALFKKMYGASDGEVRKKLVKVDWFGQSVLFTSVNDAHQHLRAVAKELAEYPELRKYFGPASTFYWRKVRGANRQSAHSYGIAIDINTSYSNYWLWRYKDAEETTEIGYQNRIPLQIVRVFEKHGFIWGGRWYHYDTMHFEYRPEILMNMEK